MVIRLANPEDKDAIEAYCAENDFYFPSARSLYTVWNDDNKLIALGGLEIIIKIEPFIADNPISAKVLYNELLKVLTEQHIERVECFTTNKKVKKLRPLYEKLGFVFAEQTNRFLKRLNNANN